MNLFRSHGFLLNRLAHIGSNQLERELLFQFDITLSQWAVLSIVWEEEGIALSRIQEVLDVKVSTASGVIKRMEKKGCSFANKMNMTNEKFNYFPPISQENWSRMLYKRLKTSITSFWVVYP